MSAEWGNPGSGSWICYRLSLSFAGWQVKPAESDLRLPGSPHRTTARPRVRDLSDGTLSITGTSIKGALRHATTSRGLPDQDFGWFTPEDARPGLLRFGQLRADIPFDKRAQDLDEVVFAGDLYVQRGGTIPHPTWRFLLTEGLRLGLPREADPGPKRSVVARDQTSEEALVASPVLRVIRKTTQDLLELLSGDPELLLEVEHRDMERIAAAAAEDLGYEVTLTRNSKDGGKDLVLRCRDNNGSAKRFYAEVKHWTSGKKVGPRELKDLLTVVVRDGADGGLLVSTSGFTMAAEQMAATSDIAELVRLVDRSEMISYVREASSGSGERTATTSLLAEVVKSPLTP